MRAQAFIPVLLLSWLGFTANASPQAQATCVPETDPATPVDTVCTTTRDVAVYFGTLSVVGAPSPDQDFAEFSDLIVDAFRVQLQNDPLVDPRVQRAAPSFVSPLNAIDWVLGVPDNFPAQGNLLDDYAAAAAALDALFGPGALTVSSAALGYMPTYVFQQFSGEIVSTARELAARGWTPATSSNFSMRLGEAHAAITVSGLDKGRLTEDGVMVVDLDGPLACGGDEEATSACLRTSSHPFKQTGSPLELARQIPIPIAYRISALEQREGLNWIAHPLAPSLRAVACP